MAINKVEVVINGNILSLQGEASEAHMQRVAKVINEKLAEIQAAYEKTRLPVSKLNQLLTLNLADEYVKKQEELEQQLESIQQLKEEKEKLQERIRNLMLENDHIKEEIVIKAQHKNHTNRGR